MYKADELEEFLKDETLRERTYDRNVKFNLKNGGFRYLSTKNIDGSYEQLLPKWMKETD